jgi:invasion protein IalB
MRQASTIVLSALAILLAGPAAAQTTEAPAGAAGRSRGRAASRRHARARRTCGRAGGLGEPYVGAEFTDWVLRCVRTDTGNDPCQLYQLLADQEGNSVAEISVFPLPDGQEAEAGVTIITPLETLLTEQVVMRVDEAQPKRYPFTFCSAVGCVSRIGLLPEEVDSFRRGSGRRCGSCRRPRRTSRCPRRLARGFTAGFQALVDGQEALRARGGRRQLSVRVRPSSARGRR